LLEDKKVPSGIQAKLSRMGIPNWAFVLVYQRDDMSGGRAEKLAKQDEDVPTM
jgi:hypothetical protein